MQHSNHNNGGDARTAGCAAQAGQECSCFETTSCWIFDLDNTLYPAQCDLFSQVADRMNIYIENLFGISSDEARVMRRNYYLEFGTTLSGLMTKHNVDPDEFLTDVHDIDYSVIARNDDLAKVIDDLPGQHLIFTNGTRRHAEQVAGRLGVLDCFDDIFDIKDADYIPKPKREAFDGFLSRHSVDPKQSAMFEDLPHNLVTAHELGIATVLVASEFDDHPSQKDVVVGKELPFHIHHVTDDLTGFLNLVCPAKSG